MLGCSTSTAQSSGSGHGNILRQIWRNSLEEADLEWEAGTLMLDHRPQLQVEAGEEVPLEEEECHEDDGGHEYDEAHEKDQVEQPCQEESPLILLKCPLLKTQKCQLLADQPRLERGLERDAPLISRFVAFRLVYGNRAP
eukprot:4205279-Amphidinium_carterae.1